MTYHMISSLRKDNVEVEKKSVGNEKINGKTDMATFRGKVSFHGFLEWWFICLFIFISFFISLAWCTIITCTPIGKLR